MMGKHQVTKGLLSSHCRLFRNKPPTTEEEQEDASQAGVNKASKGGIIYGDYLQVENSNYNTCQPLYLASLKKDKYRKLDLFSNLSEVLQFFPTLSSTK